MSIRTRALALVSLASALGLSACHSSGESSDAFCGPDAPRWFDPVVLDAGPWVVWGDSHCDVWAAGSTILHWDGATWSSTSTDSVRGLWGSSPTDVWAVGDSVAILHWNGSAWSKAAVSLYGQTYLFAVGGSLESDVWAVGLLLPGRPGLYINPVILHWDGNGWSSDNEPVPISDPASVLPIQFGLYSLWSNSPLDVWTVGDGGAILHWDGTAWSAVASGTGATLSSVWGDSASDVWAVGSSGTILHWDGAGWAAVPSGTEAYLNSVWGSSARDVFAVGDAGTILHWDGTGWSNVASGAAVTLSSVWGSSANDVVAVGGGSVFHWDGSEWSQTSHP